ncbi:MAG: hypothetical protein CL772_03275 [Chloroflexi bacterium]|nr:hypothetical protein [Chloroflexota bacterium]|tara:strand:- start:10187 stop:10399 length:213 start_codon:yes stop_codon:yes gene_type:complete
MNEDSKNLDNLTVSELSTLAENIHEEIMDLYDKEDSDEIFEQIEEKTRFFNEVKAIIRELHSDERYPRGG